MGRKSSRHCDFLSGVIHNYETCLESSSFINMSHYSKLLPKMRLLTLKSLSSAFELFDFAKQDSKVSKEYEAALDVALKFGVKIVYVGSIDDQLVSLEVDNSSQHLFLRKIALICQ